MPLYEYVCHECGLFSAIRKMSESALPANCGLCGRESDRIISVPKFALLDSARRVAYERNEKSAHDPLTLRRSSCGCTTTHTCKSGSEQAISKSNPNKPSNKEALPLQMQTKKTARPWMLGH
jgi:putative FmdB family regulatory protein